MWMLQEQANPLNSLLGNIGAGAIEGKLQANKQQKENSVFSSFSRTCQQTRRLWMSLSA